MMHEQPIHLETCGMKVDNGEDGYEGQRKFMFFSFDRMKWYSRRTDIVIFFFKLKRGGFKFK
jgi:hypothetical protein